MNAVEIEAAVSELASAPYELIQRPQKIGHSKCKSQIPFPKGGGVVRPVCTSAARKIKVALTRARDGVPERT